MKIFITSLKRRLRVILSSKLTVVMISLLSLVATLVFVRVIRAYAVEDYDSNDALIYEALNGKIAVSVNIPLSFLPLELLYPGVIVDLTENLGTEVRYLVRDVTVVGISIIESGTLGKVTVAVSSLQGENIMNARQESIGLVVKGDSNKALDDIEIVEF